jgi:hypothetical protein
VSPAHREITQVPGASQRQIQVKTRFFPLDFLCEWSVAVGVVAALAEGIGFADLVELRRP